MKFFSATTLLSACVAGVLGLGLPALAQTNGGAPQNGASQEAPPAAAPSSESQTTAPVLWVSSVEVLRSAHGPELDVVHTGDAEQDALTNTAAFTAAIERYVRQYPEQWLWMHRRWKTRPPGEAGIY